MNITFFTDNTLCAIPVHPQTKRPKPSEWQKRHAKHNNAAEFSPDDNAGVVLGTASGGLVDIDLDSELARQLAPHFLPRTGWIFGRRSARPVHIISLGHPAIPDVGGSSMSAANSRNIEGMVR